MKTRTFIHVSLSRIIVYAEKIITVATDLLREAGQPDKSGGYLVVFRTAYPIAYTNPALIAALGFSPADTVERRIAVATEKCRRLESGAGQGHLTSYESRDPEGGRWGGAVRADPYILSFSGLPELWDEAAMLVLAICLFQLCESDVLGRISEERNPYLRPLLRVRHWTE